MLIFICELYFKFNYYQKLLIKILVTTFLLFNFSVLPISVSKLINHERPLCPQVRGGGYIAGEYVDWVEDIENCEFL